MNAAAIAQISQPVRDRAAAGPKGGNPAQAFEMVLDGKHRPGEAPAGDGFRMAGKGGAGKGGGSAAGAGWELRGKAEPDADADLPGEAGEGGTKKGDVDGLKPARALRAVAGSALAELHRLAASRELEARTATEDANGETAPATGEDVVLETEPREAADGAGKEKDGPSAAAPQTHLLALHAFAPLQRVTEAKAEAAAEAGNGPKGGKAAHRGEQASGGTATALLKAQLSAAASPLAALIALPVAAQEGGMVEIRENAGASEPAGATGRVRSAAASLGLFASVRPAEAAGAERPSPDTAPHRLAAEGEGANDGRRPAQSSRQAGRQPAESTGERSLNHETAARRTADRDGAADEWRKLAPASVAQAGAAPGAGTDKPAPGAVAPADFGRFVAAELRGQASAQGAAAAAAPFSLAQQHAPGVTMRQLDVRLHPAELGAVTARIRFAGNRISVEIAAETPEARHRLAAEGDTIRQALEALGFSVDALSIRLPDAASASGSEQAPQQGSAAGANPQAGESGRGEGGRKDFREGGQPGGGDADAQGAWGGEAGGRGGVDRAGGGGGVYI